MAEAGWYKYGRTWATLEMSTRACGRNSQVRRKVRGGMWLDCMVARQPSHFDREIELKRTAENNDRVESYSFVS